MSDRDVVMVETGPIGTAGSAGSDMGRGAPTPDALGELMRSFNEVTARLEETHDRLRSEVARLRNELGRANERLERSERLAALGEMAAGISHEVRNPLGSIGLYAKMLDDDLGDRPGEREIARKIARAVRGLDAIVTDVLNFSADLKPRVAPCEAAALLERALDECRGEIERVPGLVVRFDGYACGHELPADGELIHRALTNLVRNAVEAMEDDETPGLEGRMLVLSSRSCRSLGADGKRREMVGLAVSDTGPGIPTEMIGRMFNPFFTTRASGTGLGLAIVHRIVDAHGGCVVVGPRDGGGRGSTVELQLPTTACERGAASEVVVRAAHSATPALQESAA